MDWAIESCARCGSKEFGVSSRETSTEITFVVECKRCLKVFHEWGYPTEKGMKPCEYSPPA